MKTFTNTIKALKALCKKAQNESTYSIFLKTPVKVGENKNGAVLCVSIDNNINEFYDVNHLVLGVIFDKKPDDLYGEDYSSSMIIFENEKNFAPRIVDEKDVFTVHPNALELVLEALTLTGDEWINYQTNLRIRSLFYLRWAIQQGNNRRDKTFKISTMFKRKRTWDEEIEWMQVKSEIENLMWRRPINYDKKRLEEMIVLGEKGMKIKRAKEMKLFKRLMPEMKERIIKRVKAAEKAPKQ